MFFLFLYLYSSSEGPPLLQTPLNSASDHDMGQDRTMYWVTNFSFLALTGALVVIVFLSFSLSIHEIHDIYEIHDIMDLIDIMDLRDIMDFIDIIDLIDRREKRREKEKKGRKKEKKREKEGKRERKE